MDMASLLYMWFLVFFAPPHDDPPSLAGEEDPIPSAQKQAHFPSTWRRGKEGTRESGKRNLHLHLVFRGRWTIARGPSHTPFGGVRNLANTYRRCGANWAPPYNSQLILPQACSIPAPHFGLG
eukprot:scaffold8340_cov108-Isochrysis_galbana.AAC.1